MQSQFTFRYTTAAGFARDIAVFLQHFLQHFFTEFVAPTAREKETAKNAKMQTKYSVEQKDLMQQLKEHYAKLKILL